MAHLKGITVRLYEMVQTGIDTFGAPIYTETPVEVGNVLVCPVSTDDIVADIQLYGKHAVYELCIPKGDDHAWEDRTVEFFNKKWRTFGFPKEYINEMVPLDWNRKVRVERYG